MLSQISLKSLLLTYRTAATLRFVPFIWNKQEKKLVIPDANVHGGLWKIQGYIGISARILFGLYFITRAALSSSSADALLSALFVCVWFLTLPTHAFYFSRSPQIVRLFNSLISINKQAETVLSNLVELEKRDGLEEIFRMMATMAITSQVLIPAGVFYSVFNQLPMFRFLHFGPENFSLTALGALMFSYLLIVDWTFGAMELYTIVLNSNTTYLWQLKLEQAWLNHDMSMEDTQAVLLLRRTFETHHIITLDTRDTIIGINIMMGEVYMTLITFSLIRFRNNFHPFIASAFFCFTVYTLNAVKLSVCIAANLGEASKRSAGPPRFWIPDRDVVINRRGRPMEIQLGKSVKIKQETFFSILNDIVINSVINLLLTF